MQSVHVEGLVKCFGTRVAVDGISFGVDEGELFGFLGPNGAGKSTNINILCTMLRPTGGRALVNGFDAVRQAGEVRRSIGVIFQEPSLDERLTASENLELHARIYGVPRAVRADRKEQLLRLVDLWDRRNDPVKTFSGGMRRRLEVARGLLHRPNVLFLDEPTIGLDPESRERIWSYLLQLRARDGVTLFLTTHYMDEAERCDRIAIVDHGRIVALDPPDRLKALVGGDVISIQAADAERAAASLDARFGLQPTRRDGSLVVEVAAGEQFIPRLVAELDVPIQAISLHRPTLDDVFLKLTGGAIDADQSRPNGAERSGAPRRPEGRSSVATPAAGDPRPATLGRSRIGCSAALNAIVTMWYRDLLRSTRDRIQVSIRLVQPVLLLLIFGAGLTPTVGRMGPGQAGPDYVQFMVPGVVAMAVFFTAMTSARRSSGTARSASSGRSWSPRSRAGRWSSARRSAAARWR